MRLCNIAGPTTWEAGMVSSMTRVRIARFGLLAMLALAAGSRAMEKAPDSPKSPKKPPKLTIPTGDETGPASPTGSPAAGGGLRLTLPVHSDSPPPSPIHAAPSKPAFDGAPAHPLAVHPVHASYGWGADSRQLVV